LPVPPFGEKTVKTRLAVAGCASAVAGKFVKLNTEPQSRIEPNYKSEEFMVVWEADFRVRLSAIIGFGAKLAFGSLKQKGSLQRWREVFATLRQA